MSWWMDFAKELSGHYVRLHITIAVGTREDGWWQAIGSSVLSKETARMLATSNGETHVNWVQVPVWVPRQHITGGEVVELEAVGGSEPSPVAHPE